MKRTFQSYNLSREISPPNANQQEKNKDHSTIKQPSKKTIILQPVAMRIPNKHCVYSPSQFSPQKKLSEEEFQRRYARHRHEIRVCFDENPSAETIYERSTLVTAYGFGVDCWYILVSSD